MLFNSSSYALFLPIVFGIYWVVPHKYRWILMLISSYVFNMFWRWYYVVLLFFATLISFSLALLIEKTRACNIGNEDAFVKLKKLILLAAVISCMGMLFVFKYYNFAVDTISDIINTNPLSNDDIYLKLALPVGISFYTFQTLGYVIDVYRGRIQAEHHFGYYATFISFFPQLVAGPIERADNLLPQIKKRKFFDYEGAKGGIALLIWGFFKKLAISDVIANFVDMMYKDPGEYAGLTLIIGAMMFSLQIYCDFSGYSDIAIGIARLFGIELMTNFRSPFMAISVKDLWRRWHISLSSWFTDYVYIPLGGNRVSKIKHSINLMITFLLSGLWHGANWTYVVWGGLNGVALALENSLRTRFNFHIVNGKMMMLLRRLLVFVFFSFSFVFFRALSIGQACLVIKRQLFELGTISMIISDFASMNMKYSALIALVVSILVLYFVDHNSYIKSEIIVPERPLIQVLLIVWTFFVYTILGVTNTSFIYFQF